MKNCEAESSLREMERGVAPFSDQKVVLIIVVVRVVFGVDIPRYSMRAC